jgi:hypothetical protein
MELRFTSKVIAAGGVLLALLLLYVALSTAGSFRFCEVSDFLNYNMLGESILVGQVHLKQGVHPGRAKAKDASNPMLAFPYISDAIIFEGKYYFLQEPLPGLIHAAFIMVTGKHLPTGAVVVGAAFGALLWVGLILQAVRKTLLPESPEWIFWFTWMSFALSGTQLYMVSRPVVYHESIVAGMFFCLGGTVLFFHSLLKSQYSNALLWLSGLCLGAAVLCRITLILYPLSFALCLLLRSGHVDGSAREIAKMASRLLFPVACCVAVLLAYNYARFGDFLDFGRRYVAIPFPILYAYCCIHDQFFRLAHIPINLSIYLVSLPDFINRWPFMTHPIEWVTKGDVLIMKERVSSLLFMVPSLVLCFPFSRWFNARPWGRPEKAIIAAALLPSLATLLFFGLFVATVGRYLYEFTPLLFVLVLLTVNAVWARVRVHPGQGRLFLAVLVILFILNAFAGLVLGLDGLTQQLTVC